MTSRVIALGASNLTRGLPTLVSAVRAAAGPEAEVLGALGLGRSYGMKSRVLVRTLPGILDCGLWSALAERPPRPTRALVTDGGNDLLYGAPARAIVEWVAEAVRRLRRFTTDLVMTGLPLEPIRRLSRAKFLACRSLFYPPCRLGQAQVMEAAEEIAAGLARLARENGARFVEMRPAWYGFDPIHVRPARWREAWTEILGLERAPRPRLAESLRLLALAPERQWLLGRERTRRQDGVALPGGGRVWLY